MPGEPEALGLLALMLHLDARRDARRDAAGDYVPLAGQDPARWDMAAIAEAEALLRAASRSGRPGRYQLEAAVQSAHAARRRTGRADWPAIERLYDARPGEHRLAGRRPQSRGRDRRDEGPRRRARGPRCALEADPAVRRFLQERQRELQARPAGRRR